jgi:hypothetical protein
MPRSSGAGVQTSVRGTAATISWESSVQTGHDGGQGQLVDQAGGRSCQSSTFQVHPFDRNHPGRPWAGPSPGLDSATGEEMVAAMNSVDGAIMVSSQRRLELRHGLARRRPGRHRIDGRPPHHEPAAAAGEAGESRASGRRASRRDAGRARPAVRSQPLDGRRVVRAPRSAAAGGMTRIPGNGTSRRTGISCRSSPGYRSRPLRHDSGGVR